MELEIIGPDPAIHLVPGAADDLAARIVDTIPRR